jgi:hypothetical protein
MMCEQIDNAPDLLALCREALAFIDGEADARACCGDDLDAYQSEPRALADRLRASIAKYKCNG